MAARTDNVTDPDLARRLLVMRRGQAFWARKLNELSDNEFDGRSLLPGWTRRHLVAHVGFNARAIARLVEWARTDIETPMYESSAQRAEEIDFGATLPTEALRNLAAHSAVHLNVEWRDLPASAWSREVRTAQGRLVPVSETVWMRTREVWVHAVDLANGACVDDFPAELIDELLEDLIRVWTRKRVEGSRDIVLEPVDRDRNFSLVGGKNDALIVRGTAAAVVGWGIGRSCRGVTTPDGSAPGPAPDWL